MQCLYQGIQWAFTERKLELKKVSVTGGCESEDQIPAPKSIMNSGYIAILKSRCHIVRYVGARERSYSFIDEGKNALRSKPQGRIVEPTAYNI